MTIFRKKKISYLLLAIIIVAIARLDLIHLKNNRSSNPGSQISNLKSITINDSGLRFQLATARATVGEVLDELKIQLYPQDSVSPDLNTPLAPNSSIIINRSVFKQRIIVPFKTIFKDDHDLAYGLTKIIQEGQPGQIEQTLLITFINLQETSQKILEEKIFTSARPKIIAQGTKLIFTGFEERGKASWYTKSNRLIAAHPSLKKETSVLVTNLDNGKKVIVAIAGWGPDRSIFPQRVIDLSIGAFWKLGHPYQEGILHNIRIQEIWQP
ncbi:MAG TPA: DUF348 domain-containing protein [Candidatus Portnoybacteria bacterium]|nr:DUF348 domain-containing protein [Candidatus Portnoybacteria bacterium]